MNKRDFLKTILMGGGAVAVAKATGVVSAQPTKTIVVEKVITVTEPFPQNISPDEMAIWLTIKERRRQMKAERYTQTFFTPCPDCGHQHRLSACVCGCQNKAWRD